MKRTLKITFSKTGSIDGVNYKLKRAVKRGILATLKHESFPYPAEVSVTFTDNEYIHELNKRYRGVDRHTDVLSFPMYEGGEFDECECINGAVLGDIVISVERAREQAEEIGNSFIDEVGFLAIHSTLHLLGYDHEISEREDKRQCEAQKEIVKTLKH